MNINDTIVSQSTPKGVGPTAVIRVSGNDSIDIVNNIFPSKKHSLIFTSNTKIV